VEAEAEKAEKVVAKVLEAEVKVAKAEKVLERAAKAKAKAVKEKVQEKVKANHRELEKVENPLKMATHLAVEKCLRTLNKQRKPLKRMLWKL
jgi:membrane protein involved in colicin uptake